MYSELSIDHAILKDVISKKVVTTSGRKSFVSHIIEKYKLTYSRVCRLMGLSRSVFGYQAKRSDDATVEVALKKLASKYKRYGFRKLFCKPRRQGFIWNHKKGISGVL